MKTYAIILASGTGSRFGGSLPKQFTKIGESTIFEMTINAFEKVDGIDEIIAVITPEYVDFAKDLVSKNGYKKTCKNVLKMCYNNLRG